jgi:hypothetical protein
VIEEVLKMGGKRLAEAKEALRSLLELGVKYLNISHQIKIFRLLIDRRIYKKNE